LRAQKDKSEFKGTKEALSTLTADVVKIYDIQASVPSEATFVEAPTIEPVRKGGYSEWEGEKQRDRDRDRWKEGERRRVKVDSLSLSLSPRL
jgi:hypothetical protein